MRPSIKLASLPALAAVLALARWLLQGTGNVWSKLSVPLYLPDSDLGWRRTTEHFTWLGLDAVLGLAALSLGTFVVIYFLHKRGRASRFVQMVLLLPLAATLIVPIYAFASGLPGKGARETRPGLAFEAPSGGIHASLPGLPSGRYTALAHGDAAITAQLRAGGDTFEARFAGGLEGTWIADPSDLSQPMQATVSVLASSIETGIDLRNEHAREELQPKKYPKVQFTLGEIQSTQADGESVRFAANGEFVLGGRSHEKQVTGRLTAIGPELKEKLGLGDGTYVLVQAQLTLDISETILGNDGTFDTNEIPVAATLILKHTE